MNNAAEASRRAIEAKKRKELEALNPPPKIKRERKARAPRHVDDYESRRDDLGESPDY